MRNDRFEVLFAAELSALSHTVVSQAAAFESRRKMAAAQVEAIQAEIRLVELAKLEWGTLMKTKQAQADESTAAISELKMKLDSATVLRAALQDQEDALEKEEEMAVLKAARVAAALGVDQAVTGSVSRVHDHALAASLLNGPLTPDDKEISTAADITITAEDNIDVLCRKTVAVVSMCRRTSSQVDSSIREELAKHQERVASEHEERQLSIRAVRSEKRAVETSIAERKSYVEERSTQLETEKKDLKRMAAEVKARDANASARPSNTFVDHCFRSTLPYALVDLRQTGKHGHARSRACNSFELPCKSKGRGGQDDEGSRGSRGHARSAACRCKAEDSSMQAPQRLRERRHEEPAVLC